jgi:hypothetical protein
MGARGSMRMTFGISLTTEPRADVERYDTLRGGAGMGATRHAS